MLVVTTSVVRCEIAELCFGMSVVSTIGLCPHPYIVPRCAKSPPGNASSGSTTRSAARHEETGWGEGRPSLGRPPLRVQRCEQEE